MKAKMVLSGTIILLVGFILFWWPFIYVILHISTTEYVREYILRPGAFQNIVYLTLLGGCLSIIGTVIVVCGFLMRPEKSKDNNLDKSSDLIENLAF